MVEDDEGIRESMASLINSHAPFRCTGIYPDAESALRGIPGDRADVVLMDINLPKMDGIECVRRLKVALPETQVVMLTVYEDSERIFQALSAGATGYLVKRTPPEELVAAIQEVHGGGSPMSHHIARKVVQSFHRLGRSDAEIENLTPREEQVLDLLAQGYIYKEIADQLGISIETVRTHIRKIYEKLHVRSRTEAVARYVRHQG